MHVALVYNMKREAEEEESRVEDRHRGNNGDPTSFPAATAVEPTRADTYAEWDTKETVEAVAAALRQYHTVTLIEANEEAFQLLRDTRPEIVFNMAEGFQGASREAQIPAILEMLGIPYTGSDPITLGICLDKSRAKEILSHHGVPTARFKVVSRLSELGDFEFELPAIIKPLHEGSSKGIFDQSVVRTRDDLKFQIEKILVEYGQPALVEQFLPGREFTVALLGNNEEVRVLPIIEMKFDSLPKGVNHIYSFEAKWIWDQSDSPIDVHECPAKIDEKLKLEIENICRRAYDVLSCRDWCRIDVRLDEQGAPHILELNPLPGILPNPEDHSCFPLAARMGGMSYVDLINEPVRLAAKRYGLV
ncbi:MAG: ATP-grasp domain-containing protein [Ignavibacteria bacterium]|nr:ATP-grasp domain-containing protein [Ignavibacteria bacterium]